MVNRFGFTAKVSPAQENEVKRRYWAAWDDRERLAVLAYAMGIVGELPEERVEEPGRRGEMKRWLERNSAVWRWWRSRR